MRDFNLRFFSNRRWPDGMINLIEIDDLSCIPNCNGAYVLGANSPHNLVYPWGTSPVFYIGQSTNLFNRITEHKKYILAAIEDHAEKNSWPRYQYGAALGAVIAWYSCRGQQDPNRLESDLINSFYECYGSIPVANGTWPSGLRKILKGEAE